jgi:hypothetical protein
MKSLGVHKTYDPLRNTQKNRNASTFSIKASILELVVLNLFVVISVPAIHN